MAIITIARQRGAYGRTVAKKLAETIGAKYIDKELVDARLEELGILPKHRAAFDEKKPSFFSALTSAVEEYVNALRLVMYNEAKCGHCVILGRGGQSIFKDIPGTVRARLIAPKDVRARRLAEAEDLTEDQARQVLDSEDRDRSGFNTFFFDVEWDNPLNYDVVLNTAALSEPQVIGIISDMANAVSVQQTECAVKTLENKVLGQSVEREILFAKKVPIFFLNATCENGIVTLRGVAHSNEAIEEAKAIAAAADGVKSVTSQIQLGLHGHYQRGI